MSRRADVAHGTDAGPRPAVPVELGSDVGPALLGEPDSAMSSWPRQNYLAFGAVPTAVPSARQHARQVLREWKLDHLAEDVAILVSELMTNAIKASMSSAGVTLVALRLLASDEQLLIEVWDQSPDDPRPRTADDEAEDGRGFAVIEAFSHRWGYRRVSAGVKVVWCELVTERD